MPARRRVTVASGLPLGALDRHPDYSAPDLTLSFDGPRPNVLLDLERLIRDLHARLSPRLCDLLAIAVTVYAADLAFPRGENEDWVRHTTILMPVRDVEFWREVEPQLAEFLYVLSHDSYVFEFVERTEDRAEAERQRSRPERPDSAHDCVALLSGGLDSFAGATMLLATGRRPLFVAYRPANVAVAGAQEHVRECLARRFGDEVELVVARWGPAPGSATELPYPSPEARENSQRTRAFLFLALGAAACQATGSDVLYCPENGILAVNLPLTAARVGGYSTAGTHPRTLATCSQLLAALGLTARVENPFLYQTKGQLLRDLLKPHFATAEIQGAVSCWMAGRASRPCGTCIPCLVRSLAMATAGLPREAYLVDPLSTGTGPESAARANLVDLVALTQRFRTLEDAELLQAYPALLELAPEASIRGVVAMLRRFAEEAREALDHLDPGNGGP